MKVRRSGKEQSDPQDGDQIEQAVILNPAVPVATQKEDDSKNETATATAISHKNKSKNKSSPFTEDSSAMVGASIGGRDVMDIETALAHLFQDCSGSSSSSSNPSHNSPPCSPKSLHDNNSSNDNNTTTTNNTNNNTNKPSTREILGKNNKGEEEWVLFRIGHAGDVSALANLCRRRKPPSNSKHIMSKRRRCEEDGHRGGDGNGDGNGDGDPHIVTTKDNDDDDDDDNANNRNDVAVVVQAQVADSECDDKVTAAATTRTTKQNRFNINKNSKNDVEIADSTSESEEHDTELEMKLASGFGDEQTPPAFHVILADVYKREKENEKQHENEKEHEKEHEHESKSLSGGAIVTLEWDANQSVRVLRVELLKVDERYCSFGDLLLRRMILRLSALGLAIGCGVMKCNRV